MRGRGNRHHRHSRRLFGGITYVATHEKTVIMHSDTGDYACTVSPLSHKPTSCKPIEGTK